MAAETPAQVRKNPCGSCPYRRDVPSGIWDRREYEILPDFDGDPGQQAASGHGLAVFGCHQADGSVCAGWAGHRDPGEVLAIRIGVIQGRLSPDVLDYRTDVPLFASGAEAAAHGLRDLGHPGADAVSQAGKILRVRALRGNPVTGTGD